MLFKTKCRISLKRLLSFSLIVAASTYGQTSKDLASRYPSVSAFEVRQGILMTTNFSQDGQVCEIILEKRHETPAKTDLSAIIPPELVKQLIDELAPATERGHPAKRYALGDSESTITGNVEVRESEFENVSIRIIGSLSESCSSGDEVIIIRWKKRTCAISKAPTAVLVNPRTSSATTNPVARSVSTPRSR